jgi:hypothetical protein
MLRTSQTARARLPERRVSGMNSTAKTGAYTKAFVAKGVPPCEVA